MCAKLCTIAASNNRDHARNLSYYCLLALHTVYNGVILHAHPVRGESHNQCNATGEVATLLYCHEYLGKIILKVLVCGH